MQGTGRVTVDQATAQVTKAAGQSVQCPDRTADVGAALAAIVRLLARQAAREHLARQPNPDAEEIPDER